MKMSGIRCILIDDLRILILYIHCANVTAKKYEQYYLLIIKVKHTRVKPEGYGDDHIETYSKGNHFNEPFTDHKTYM
jgi:hypothetical protein